MNGRKIIFLDRDGVINRMTQGEYVLRPEQFEILPGAVEGMKDLSDRGYEMYIITNQPGIGKGMMTEADLAAIHAKLEEALKAQDARLGGIYYCPHIAEDNCDCRKPKPGLLIRAAKEHDFDLREALFIGDDLYDRDKKTGEAAGCKTYIMPGNGNLQNFLKENPEI